MVFCTSIGDKVLSAGRLGFDMPVKVLVLFKTFSFVVQSLSDAVITQSFGGK